MAEHLEIEITEAALEKASRLVGAYDPEWDDAVEVVRDILRVMSEPLEL